jgi:glutaredoxin
VSLTVQLYTKPGCHLCEQARIELDRLQRRYPHQLDEIDITSQPELLQRYGERIPVIRVQGREYAAPLSAQLIERALKEARAHAP